MMVHRDAGWKGKDLEGESLPGSPPSWTLASAYVTSHHVLPGAAHNSLDVWD